MAKIFKAPESWPYYNSGKISDETKFTQAEEDTFSVFLGGSIEMGKAEDWQTEISDYLSDLDINILNPRRDDFDPDWPQDPTPGTKFHEQVTWELNALEEADYRIFYFAKDTMSPITLMELGLHTKAYSFHNRDKVIVYVDKDYKRAGNVLIFCNRYNVPVYQDKEEFKTKLKRNIQSRIIRHAESLRG